MICIPFLILFALVCSCSPSCRGWVYDEVSTSCGVYDSSRLYLPRDLSTDNLEVEVIQSTFGTRVYLNVFSLSLPYDPNYPDKVLILLYIAGEEHHVLAERLLGAQRALLPDDSAQLLINALLDNQTVHIRVGRYHADIVPEKFSRMQLKMRAYERSKS